MKILSALSLCGAVLASGAFAAETAIPLPSGKPAGVKKAQVENTVTPWLFVGLGAAALVLVAVGPGGSNNTTTTGTP